MSGKSLTSYWREIVAIIEGGLKPDPRSECLPSPTTWPSDLKRKAKREACPSHSAIGRRSLLSQRVQTLVSKV